MELKFDARQEYQIRAIDSVADLFEGQPKIPSELVFVPGASFAAAPNRLDIGDDVLLRNLQTVQSRNGLKPDPALEFIDGEIDTPKGRIAVRFPNFSVEMETGTGKTYVYIRTALELCRRYGLRKFIIVVPSVAIREGVLKTLQITQKHLHELYDSTPYRFYEYDSDNISQIRQFALWDSVDLMVMTIDSFNKAKNVIYQARDRLQGERPVQLIQAARPVLILDEPQNMESEISVKSLVALYPLFALRYSATHRNPYNVVYRLTPYAAYQQGLVKRIEVAGVTREKDENRPFVRLDGVKAEKKTLTARLTVRTLLKNMAVKEQTVTVRPNDDLAKKTNRPEYAGYTVSEISALGGFIKFGNGIRIHVGESQGDDKQAVFEAQIRYTIETHFEKQRRLKPEGIKVLSLFFIDRVDNYVREDGIIRRLFEKCFNELKSGYPEWKDRNPQEVRAAYFAQKRRKWDQVEFLDSQSGKTKEDQAAFELIMRDKERLLSLEEPVSFIFSHSALREGWDNPNVFQICTLNQTVSDIKKRQEIGRGVRLAVNQEGDRLHDERINRLTVVANESYEKYVATLQSEIEFEYGREGVPPPPADARKRSVMRLRKEYVLRPEFKELWARISRKTWYSVSFDTEGLLAEVLPELDKAAIDPPRLSIRRGEVKLSDAEVLEAVYGGGGTISIDYSGEARDVVGMMLSLMERSTPPVRLTRRTLVELVKRTANRNAAVYNPFEFSTTAVQILKQKLADHLVNGIQYTPLDEWYEMSELKDLIEGYEEYLIPASRSLYDKVEFESEVERRFVADLEKRPDVLLYVKLPGWFTVDTPVGKYNPDWAIVVEKLDEHGRPVKRLYLVRETKGSDVIDHLQWPNERRKTICGEKHFVGALGVDYKFGKSAGDLLP